LKYAVQKFPRGLLTGSCPLSWISPNTPRTSSIKVNHHHETRLGESTGSTTRPSPGPIIPFNTHEQFTNHDIEELNTLLEKNLLPTDSSIRLSRSITSKESSRSSIVSQRSNLSTISNKPWKP